MASHSTLPLTQARRQGALAACHAVLGPLENRALPWQRRDEASLAWLLRDEILYPSYTCSAAVPCRGRHAVYAPSATYPSEMTGLARERCTLWTLRLAVCRPPG